MSDFLRFTDNQGVMLINVHYIRQIKLEENGVQVMVVYSETASENDWMKFTNDRADILAQLQMSEGPQAKGLDPAVIPDLLRDPEAVADAKAILRKLAQGESEGNT